MEVTKHPKTASRQSVRSMWSLLLLFVVMLIPHGAWAEGTQPSGTGGSTGEAYQIGTVQELIWFRDAVNGVNTTAANGGYYHTGIIGELTADIDLSNVSWIPIGKDASHAFTGKLLGNGKTIKGLSVTTSGDATSSYWGLFGCVNGAEIKEFTLKGSVSITNSSYSYIGTVAGCATGNSKIISVTSEVNITVNSGQTPSYIGGIVGSVGRSGYNCNSSSIPTATVQECTYTGTISCAKSHTAIGGIVGGVWYGSAETELNHGIKINQCIFNGAINRTENTNSLGSYPGIGGILGSARTTGEVGITYNLSKGTITCDVANSTLANHIAAIIGRPVGSKCTTTYIKYNCGLTGTASKLFGNSKESDLSSKNYLLTVASNNTTFGTVSIPGVPTTSNQKTYLELVATPSECCDLIKWSDNTTACDYNVELTGNLTLTAYFQQVEPYHNQIWYTTTDGNAITTNILTGQMGLTGSTYDSANSRFVMSFSQDLTSIAMMAFKDCSTLQTFTIPSTVTDIYESAFLNCTALQSITIPSGVQTIGGEAFTNCCDVRSVTIPESVGTIGLQAFKNCAVIQSGLSNNSSITNDALAQSGLLICDAEQEDGLLTKGTSAVFCRKSATIVTIPSNVKSIGTRAFKDCCNLTTINIPEGVTDIGVEAFYGCRKLNSLTIPNSVKTIESKAFANCRDLAYIEMQSDDPIDIGTNAFLNCFVVRNNLQTTTDLSNYGLKVCSSEQVDGLLLYNKDDETISCRSWATDVSVPVNVDSLRAGTFAYCDNLQSITLHSIPYFGDDAINCRTIRLSLSDDSFIYTKNNKDNGSSHLTEMPTYTRVMKNKWGTIILPFAVNIDANRENYDFYQIKEINTNALTLEKITGNTLAACTPVLIRMSEATKNNEQKYELSLIASNKKIELTIPNKTVGSWYLVGSYENVDITDTKGYILSNNAFWNIQAVKGNKSVYNMAFHAYLYETSKNSPTRLDIRFNDDDEANAIEAIFAPDDDAQTEYYDMNGRRIPDLQQGINIVKRGNKTFKVIIK